MIDPRLFQALSDRTRLEILSLLAGGAANVSRIVAHVGCAQPAVSRHLRVLREASLIADRRKGKQVEYSIKPAALKAAAAYMADIAGGEAAKASRVAGAEPANFRVPAAEVEPTTPSVTLSRARKPQHAGPGDRQPAGRQPAGRGPGGRERAESVVRPRNAPAAAKAKTKPAGPRAPRASRAVRQQAREATRAPVRAAARDFTRDEAEFRVESKPRPKSGLDDFLL